MSQGQPVSPQPPPSLGATPSGPVMSPDGAWWWDGAAWRPTRPAPWWPAPAAGPAAAPWQTPATRPRPGFAAGGLLGIIAAVGLVVGSVLPWATASFSLTSISRSGTDGGDGWFFVAGAGVVVILGLLALAGRASVGIGLPIVLIGTAAAALLGFEFYDAHRIIGETDSPFIDVSYGSGLYVLAVSVAAVVAAGVLEWVRAVRPGRSLA